MGITLVAVSVWLARSQNVRVSYESQRRPRVRVAVSTLPVTERAIAPVPEPAR
jgi:hypothetical protein